jgi:hypothetical protein
VLPKLAPLLPLPVPQPLFVGEPSADFPWPFFGGPVVPGQELADADLDDTARAALARPLGRFLRALHSAQLDVELPVDPLGRADMGLRVGQAREPRRAGEPGAGGLPRRVRGGVGGRPPARPGALDSLAGLERTLAE